MKTKTFRVAVGVLVLPVGTMPGPGATHARYRAGDTFTVDAVRVDRFLRRRIAAGDLVEVEPAITKETTP